MRANKVIEAIKKNQSIEEISRLIQQDSKEIKFDINEKDEKQYTALHYALLHERSQLTQLLLGAGANPEVMTSSPTLNLSEFAAKNSTFENISFLLDVFPLACQPNQNVSFENLLKENSKLNAAQRNQLSQRGKKIQLAMQDPDKAFHSDAIGFMEIIDTAYRLGSAFEQHKRLMELFEATMLNSSFSDRDKVYFDPKKLHPDILKKMLEFGIHPRHFSFLILLKKDPKLFFDTLNFAVQKIPVENLLDLLKLLDSAKSQSEEIDVKDRLKMLAGHIYYRVYHETNGSESLLAKACLKWASIRHPENLRREDNHFLGGVFSAVSPYFLSFIDCHQRMQKIVDHVKASESSHDTKASEKPASNAHEALVALGWNDLNSEMKRYLDFLITYEVFGNFSNTEFKFYMYIVDMKLNAEQKNSANEQASFIVELKKNLDEKVKQLSQVPPASYALVSGLPVGIYLTILQRLQKTVDEVQKKLKVTESHSIKNLRNQSRDR